MRKIRVALIVMSMHGETHLLDFLIGGTADRILRCSPCAVLGIRTVGDSKSKTVRYIDECRDTLNPVGHAWASGASDTAVIEHCMTNASS